MFIPRELGIHKCNKCGRKLVDSNFIKCGINLHGKDKWMVYFDYDCPHCLFEGCYNIPTQDEDLPGDLFRQFGEVIDAMFFKDQGDDEDYQIGDYFPDIT